MIDPRPLSPPDPPLDPPPAPCWHFLSANWEHEHWIDDPPELALQLSEFIRRGEPFTVELIYS